MADDATSMTVFAAIPRVNLLPRAELERRERAAAIRRWGWGVVGALAVVVLVAAGAYAMNWVAQQRLADAQSKTTTLLDQMAGLSDVSVALRTRTELTTFRAQAMASDLGWYQALDALDQVAPPGVALVGFDLTSGGVPAAGADAKAQTGLIGHLTLVSVTPQKIVDVIRAFRAAPGVAFVDGTELASSDASGVGGVYAYTLAITFDQSIYSGTYAVDGAR